MLHPIFFQAIALAALNLAIDSIPYLWYFFIWDGMGILWFTARPAQKAEPNAMNYKYKPNFLIKTQTMLAL